MVIMALDIMFNHPMKAPMKNFWGIKDQGKLQKLNGLLFTDILLTAKTALIKLGIQFDVQSPKWSWENYESFVKLMSPNVLENFSILQSVFVITFYSIA